MAGAPDHLRTAAADRPGRNGARPAGTRDLVDLRPDQPHLHARRLPAARPHHGRSQPGGAEMRRQAGITLLEVLVSVTLLSLLAVGMMMALRIGLFTFSRTNARLMDDRRVAGSQHVIEQELEGLLPAVGP